MFCKHAWTVLSETTTESRFQHIAGVASFPAQEFPGEWFTRKHILVITCNKCGAVQRFVEEL